MATPHLSRSSNLSQTCQVASASVRLLWLLLGGPTCYTVLKRLGIVLLDAIYTYDKLEVYLSTVLSTVASPSFSTFIVRLDQYLPGLAPSPGIVLDDLAKRGAETGMVFHVETVDPLAPLLPTSTHHSLRLEPYRLDATTDFMQAL